MMEDEGRFSPEGLVLELYAAHHFFISSFITFIL